MKKQSYGTDPVAKGPDTGAVRNVRFVCCEIEVCCCPDSRMRLGM